MDIDGDAEEASRRIRVRFVTKLKPPYKAPPTSIAIPTNLTRFGLSALVNNLLKAGTFFFCPYHPILYIYVSFWLVLILWMVFLLFSWLFRLLSNCVTWSGFELCGRQKTFLGFAKTNRVVLKIFLKFFEMLWPFLAKPNKCLTGSFCAVGDWYNSFLFASIYYKCV